MILWFGALPHAESMSSMQPHLLNLRKRFEYLGANLDVVFYVDNCCTVRYKIKEVWPEAIVLLDPWHWLQRWRDILCDPTSTDGRAFMALMSRAILVASDAMVNERRAELTVKYGRLATLGEALRQLPTVAPDPKTMETNVQSVLSLFLYRDLMTETKLATWPEDSELPKPKLVLKDRRQRANIIRNQLSHVIKGCLTDPDKQGDPRFSDVKMYYTVGNRCYCCRGSSLCERYHKAVETDIIKSRSTIGPAVAERMHWQRNMDWNVRANVIRNGAESHLCHETEHLALANSLATQAGVDVIPFNDVSMPRKDPSAPPEKIGYRLGLEMAEDMNDNSNGGVCEEATEEAVDNLCNDMAALLQHRRTERRETTMEAFIRQSGGNPWIPFAENLHTTNPIEKAEHELFDAMSQNYERGATPSAAKGYQQFARDWEREVADRLAKSTDGETVVLVRPKSIAQLQAFYDYLQSKRLEAAQPTDESTENVRRTTHRTLLESRVAMNGRVSTAAAFPLQYPMAGPGHTVPLGVAVLQPQLFHASLAEASNGCAANAAPWQMRIQQPRLEGTGRKRQKTDGRNTCKACGWPRGDHVRNGSLLLYGKGKCTMPTCGVCYKTNIQHAERARQLGKPDGDYYMGETCVFIN